MKVQIYFHLVVSSKSLAEPDDFERITSTKKHGGLAQLGEHLLCKQGVNGSIPLASTIYSEGNQISVHYKDVVVKLKFGLLETISVSFFNNLEEVK